MVIGQFTLIPEFVIFSMLVTSLAVEQIIPKDWGSYFTSVMDDLRIFKTVLTGARIQSIYELEKVDV